jgi:hypothetical protein
MPGEINWHGRTFNPQTTHKPTAYQEVFENAPGSTVPGNRHGEALGGDVALFWFSKNYPPREARVAYDNGWGSQDVDD